MLDQDYRPRFNFSDLIGVKLTTIGESELTMEFVAEGVTSHLKLCNTYNPINSMEVGELYFFGQYNNKSMLVQFLGEKKWINRDCRLFGDVLSRSFPGEKISFLPISVVMKDIGGVVFLFTFKEDVLYRFVDKNGGLDIVKLSKG